MARLLSIILFFLYVAGYAQSNQVVTEAKKYGVTIVKKKGKFGLSNSKGEVLPAIYDSVTLATFSIEDVNKQNLLSKTYTTESYLYFWQNGLFNVCVLPRCYIWVSQAENFIPSPRAGTARAIYKANGKWGFAGFDAIYDTIRFVLVDSIDLVPEVYEKADKAIMDADTYIAYANYTTAYYECVKDGCSYLLEQFSGSPDLSSAIRICQPGYFKRSPKLQVVNTNSIMQNTYQLVTDKQLSVMYDTILYVEGYRSSIGVNYRLHSCDVYAADGHKKYSTSFAGFEAAVNNEIEHCKQQELQSIAEALQKVEEEKLAALQEQQRKIAVSKDNYEWLKSLRVTTNYKRAGYGLRTANGEVVLPECAIDIAYINTSFDVKGDSICRYYESKSPVCYIRSVPLFGAHHYIPGPNQAPDFFFSSYLRAKILIYLNGANKNEVFFYTLYIEKDFNYKAHQINSFKCPMCWGEGRLPDGKETVTDTAVYTNVVKTGESVSTQKCYLCNERVRSDGSTYVPTTTTRLDNYSIVTDTKITSRTYQKYRTCPLCNGKSTNFSATIEWVSDLDAFRVVK